MKNKEETMTKGEFKSRWNSGDYGGGITFTDMLTCAKAWGLFDSPQTENLYTVAKAVLEAAGCEVPSYITKGAAN